MNTDTLQIVGRSSSHFTRVVLMVAHELGVSFEFVPVFDLTSVDASLYAGNPALKLPALRRGGSVLFGTENICRALADASDGTKAVVWPEQLRGDVSRNAQELVWHGMAAQVQIILGTMVGKLPAEHPYFVKGREGFQGALRWLDDNIDEVLSALSTPRDVSLFEVTLFCLVEHIAFRGTLPLEPYASLRRFAAEFGKRPSAQRTVFRMDTPPPS